MAHAVIVGAGPAGAALAYLLVRRDIDVTLIERYTDFAREFRGEVLLPGGLQALAQMGLWEKLQDVPQVRLAAAELYINGSRRLRAALDPQAFKGYPPRWVSQPALLELLVTEAGAHPSFRLERGATVRDLLLEGGRVVGVRVHSERGEREIRADLVIGADGRTSVVRRRAGLPVVEDRIPMDIVWCKVPWPRFLGEDRAIRAYLGGGRLLVAAPVYDGRLQIGWVIRKGSFGEIRSRGMAACLEEMARHVDPDLAAHLRRHRDGAIEPFLLWTIADRVTQWTAAGVLVIGDAAHTMSPVGAQGVNVALRDAIVAANHLVPALGAPATAAGIDAACHRIQGERAREVRIVQRLQAGPPRVLLSDAWWARAALQGLGLFVRLQLGRIRAGALVGRFAFGVTDVRLQV